MDVYFPAKDSTGSVTASQIYAFKVSILQWPQPGTPTGTHASNCHVVSAEIILISHWRMSLAVLGGEQSGMKGGGPRMVKRRERGKGVGEVGLKAFVFISASL